MIIKAYIENRNIIYIDVPDNQFPELFNSEREYIDFYIHENVKDDVTDYIICEEYNVEITDSNGEIHYYGIAAEDKEEAAFIGRKEVENMLPDVEITDIKVTTK